jgi:DNA-binding transcriptional ArsR family regulator
VGALNEVKIRVRSNALDLIEFTVEKMQQVTGLNPASIRTELTRLKRQGYLTSSPLPGARQGRGAPPHLYRLTDDNDKVDELARSVEAFYQPAGPASFKPTSLHYEAAQTLLDKLESGQLPPAEQETTLARIAHHLELAAADEGIAVYQDEKTEVVAAYLTLLHARLAMAQNHWPETERYLAEARATFTVHQIEDGLQQTETLTNALTNDC